MSETPIEFANKTTCSTTSNFSFSDANYANYTDFNDILYDITYYCWDVATFFCLTTVVFGVLSWTLLPKWRQFRNYVFINASLANGTSLFLSSGYIETDSFLDYVCDVCDNAIPFWLVLAAYSFYMNVVKIFSYHSDHVYLYANVFAWAIPALICVCKILLDNEELNDCKVNDDYEYVLIEYTEAVSSILNLLIYLRVLYVLKSSGNIRSSLTVSTWQRLRIATVIFVTSGVAIFIPLLTLSRIKLKPELWALPTFVFLIQLCLMQVMFLMFKYHWTLWKEFLYKRFRRNYSIRTTTDTRNNDTYQGKEVMPRYLTRKDLPV